jgi:hypothetical protein
MDPRQATKQEIRRTRIRAWRAVEATRRAGADGYERARHLPRLIPVGPDDIADESPEGRMRILLRLARALRSERVRARGGHWTYDVNRHLGLMQAYEAESRALGRTNSPARLKSAAF